MELIVHKRTSGSSFDGQHLFSHALSLAPPAKPWSHMPRLAVPQRTGRSTIAN